MNALQERTLPPAINPIHAVLLAGTVPLFLGALFSDLAYSASYEIQWKNFASWMIVGGLVFSGLALFWAFIDLFGGHWRGKRLIYFVLLLVVWPLGFVNALVHAMDAWESMPEALILSGVVSVLAITATALGFSTFPAGGAK